MTEHHNYIDFEFAKNVKLGKGRFISKVKRKRTKSKTPDTLNTWLEIKEDTKDRHLYGKPEGF